MAWFGQVAKCLTSNAANTESRGPLLLAAGISVLGGIALGSLLHVRSTQSGQVISSPRQLLQTLPEDERKKHALPLDLFPGARDVQTPYGNIRVYEWGPEDGPKVLFVHGITTPCLALGGLAHTLADKGYRVMLFDLYVFIPCVFVGYDLHSQNRLLTWLQIKIWPWSVRRSGRFAARQPFVCYPDLAGIGFVPRILDRIFVRGILAHWLFPWWRHCCGICFVLSGLNFVIDSNCTVWSNSRFSHESIIPNFGFRVAS